MKPFSVSPRELGPRQLAIELHGELDMAVADQVKAQLLPAMAENDEVFVVLADCEFIDSTGVATLLRARNSFAANGGRLVLCEPVEQVRRVLELSGLAEDGFVVDSLAAALAGSA
jgi:anti-anti-sigma factor